MSETETVKTYRKLVDVVNYVQTVHARVREVCARVAESHSNEQIQTLMTSFAEKEGDLQQVLQNASVEQPSKVLETWVQYVPTRAVDVLLERIERVDALTWHDLAALVLQVHERTATLYEQLLEQVEADPVQRFLATLAEGEREAGKEISKKLLSLQEMGK